MTFDAGTYATEELLKDGGSIHIRAIRPDDKERLQDLHARLSQRSVYFRFFGVKRRLSADDLIRFTELDFANHVGLVATLRDGGEERIIGVGRFIRSNKPASAHRAEVAFTVDDAHQGRGIGTLLLEHLATIARQGGVSEFEADVLGENNQMIDVFARSGFVVRRSLEAGVVHVDFPTEETEPFREASERRERTAAAQSVRVFFRPHSVALIGASRDPASIGAALLKNLAERRFRGPLYVVNPKADAVAGVRCHPSVGAIGERVDLAVIAVPARAVEAVVEDCARAGVRGVVVISAGFGEASEEGREAQRRLTALVRGSGMRMVGPNCMGVLNTDPEVSLDATFAPHWPPAGNIGMLSQSGALGLAILDCVRKLNAGISTFISVGNKADVSGNDLLAYWAEDPQTDVIVLYLESFGNPRRFARIAPEVARLKPIVAVKSGRSAAGTRAAASHSAALASLDVAVDALFEQAGVIRTNTLEELFDVATLLATQPIPAGRRVGVVTNAGGPGILLADACEAHDLELPQLAEETIAALRAFLPPEAGLSNPIDMIASATPEHYERTIRIVGADPNVDSIVVIYIPPMVTEPQAIAAAVARGSGDVPREKPVLAVFLSSKEAPAELGTGTRGRLPCFTFPENAAMALAAAERYGRWRRRPQGTPHRLSRFAQRAVRAVIERVTARQAQTGWLEPHDVALLLRLVGVEYAHSERAEVDEAVETGDEMGYPLVAKAIAEGILHKSDVGGVILGIDSRRSLESAVRTLGERVEAAGARLDGVLLQREVSGGIEALVGVTTDPTFGPLLVCGLGGILVEVFRDVRFALTPVTDVVAEEMTRNLRSSKLLDGFRGAPPGDRAALVDVILRISALVEAVPELRELDLNPVKVLPPGRGAIVVDARMRVQRTGAGGLQPAVQTNEQRSS